MGWLINSFRFTILSIFTNFDGANNFYRSTVTGTQLMNLSTDEAFTMSFWVRFEDTGTLRQMISKIVNLGWIVNRNTSDKLVFTFQSATLVLYTRITSTTSFNANQWYHICFVKSSSVLGWTLYIDGVNDNGTITGNGTAISTTQTNRLTIGARSGNGTNTFLGDLDEFVVWRGVQLSAGEVLDVYNRGRVAVDYSDLYPNKMEAHWDMGESVTDSGTVLTAYPKKNHYFTFFDGTNEYNYATHSNDFNFEYNTPFSVNLWAYINTLGTLCLYSKQDNNSTTYRGYDCNIVGGQINMGIYSDFNTGQYLSISTNGAALLAGQWYHIVTVYNGDSSASNCKIYIDGVSTSFTINSDTLGSNTIQNLEPFYLSRRGNNSIYSNGFRDKLIIYNDALTAGEVTTLNNYGRTSGLVGIGNEVLQWELDTLNPVDEIGANDGISVNMDATNIYDYLLTSSNYSGLHIVRE